MDAKDRLAEISALQNALAASWGMLARHLGERRTDLVITLVSKNDDEVRGRIKEIDGLLELPERLQQEAVALQQPQETADYP